jgi:O-antigen/teichoic acid export membrane protein
MRERLGESSAAWIPLLAAAEAVLGLVGFRLVGEALGPAGYGAGMLWYGVALVFVSTLAVPVAQAVARFVHGVEFRARPGELLGASLAIVAAAVPIVALVGLIGGRLIEPAGSGSTLVHGALLVPAFVGESLHAVAAGWLTVQRRFRSAFLVSVADGVARVGLVLLLSRATDCAPETALVAGYAGGALLCGVLGLWLAGAGTAPAQPSRDCLARIGTYIAPLAASGAIGWTAANADRYIVGLKASLETVGAYVAGVALGHRAALLAGSMTETWFRPAVYESIEQGDDAALRRALARWAATLIVLLAAGNLTLALLLDPVIALLFPADFRGAAREVLPLALLGFSVHALAFVPVRVLYALGRTAWIGVLDVGTTATLLALLAAVPASLGLSGFAACIVAANALRLVVAILVVRRSLDRRSAATAAAPA